MGATGASVDSLPEPISSPLNPGVDLAVVGAHLIGQPLNHQLTSRQATFVRTARTAWSYRLFALHGTVPPKPGLVQVAHPGSGGIEVEVWNLGNEAFGSFVAAVPPPLAIGKMCIRDRYVDFCKGVGDSFHVLDRGVVVASGSIAELTEEVVKNCLLYTSRCV